MKQILVTIPVEDRHKILLEQAAGEQAALIYKPGKDVEEIDLVDVQGVIGNISPALLSTAPALEWVQLNSAGADPYLVPGILPENCILKNAVGAYGRAVSEHMLALTFALVRKLEMYGRNQVKHLWKAEGSITSVEDATILVLGLGDIGGNYAKKVKALGAYVIGIRESDKEKPEYVDEQHKLADLADLLPRADIVAAVLPSTRETKNLFSEEMLRKCKKGAYLINAGRGDAVDLVALQQVLDEGILAGAGLDVTDPEPLPAEHPLWNYENVIITPHVAGQFFLAYTFERIVELSCEHMQEWLNQS